jgi:hypothetical protein
LWQAVGGGTLERLAQEFVAGGHRVQGHAGGGGDGGKRRVSDHGRRRIHDEFGVLLGALIGRGRGGVVVLRRQSGGEQERQEEEREGFHVRQSLRVCRNHDLGGVPAAG